MADPIKTVLSLDALSRNYCIFERDQVLTAEQLNSVASYFDDQTRLSRVELLGVGIAAGFGVTATDRVIEIGKGVGITSDGDLVLLQTDTRYDAFVSYPESAPLYAPFFVGPPEAPQRIPLFELLPEGTEAAGKRLLGDLPRPLADMVVLVYVESFEQDHDLCNEVDCDNVGITFEHTQRAFLIPRDAARMLDFRPATLRERAKSLPVLLAHRPLLTGSVSTPAALVAPFRGACERTYQALIEALPELWQRTQEFMRGVFDADPSPAWRALLDARRAAFDANPLGVHYFHDHLKDLVAAYSELRDTLTECDVVTCPDPHAFPKHLLLGSPDRTQQLRFGFWPSALTSRGDAALERAASLARRLRALIEGFELPISGDPASIRVTPSRTTVAPLGERAIPFYYRPTSAELLATWSFERSRSGTERYHLAYWADKLGGAVTDPLSFDCGKYDFFRIEGHLGLPVETVVAILAGLRARYQLAFVVRTVLVHPEKRPKGPAKKYGDLHRLHQLVRADLSHGLARATAFSDAFQSRVKTAVEAKDIADSTRLAQAATHDLRFKNAASAAREGLAQATYSAFKLSSAWRDQYNAASNTAGAFKEAFGDVSRTDVVTAFDSVVTGNFKHWLDWLDVLIEAKGQKADERLRFTKYLGEHPGIEHLGGVARGGTLVLAYDDQDRVVGDFALPYTDAESGEDEADEPPLRATVSPQAREGFVVVKNLESRAADLKEAVSFELKKEVDLQKSSSSLLIQTLGALSNVKKTTLEAGSGPILTSDALLSTYLEDLDIQRFQLEGLRLQLSRSDLPEDAASGLRAQIERKERELGETAAEATRRLVSTGTSATAGTNDPVISVVGRAVGAIRNPETLGELTAKFVQLSETTADTRRPIIAGITSLGGLSLRR